MAKVSNPLIGKSSQKMGNVVFSTWKGINVLKEKAMSVANPNTTAQQMQRARLKAIVNFYRMIATIVAVGFQFLADKMSEYNAFVKENIITGTTGATPSAIAVDFPNILVSKGSLTPTGWTDPVTGAIGEKGVSWNYEQEPIYPDQSNNDLAYMVAYNETKDEWAFGFPGNNRSDEVTGADFPSDLSAGDVIHAWGFFLSADGTKVSDSVYSTGVIS